MSNSKPTMDQIKKLAASVVDGMTKEDLESYMYDDLVSLFIDDRDSFFLNLEMLGIDIDELSD